MEKFRGLMDIYLENSPWYEKIFFKVASKGLIPTIIGAFGFAYIGIPSTLQVTVRRAIPVEIREFLIMLCSTDTWLIVVLVIALLCSIWGGVGTHVSLALAKRKHTRIIEENTQLKEDKTSKSINCYRLFSNLLYSHFSHLDLGSNERVSLYKLDMDMFSCIGRYSDNEVYRSKPSRLYPKDQGAIAKAWETGTFEDATAPDSINNLDDWVKYNISTFNFSPEILQEMKMKSRSFYGFRLKNSQQQSVAVVIFESIRVDGLPFGKIKRLFNEHEKRKLFTLIESLEQHIPSLEEARTEGF